MPKRYPEEFRRKVLDLVAVGRPIAQIAADLDISDQTIYGWRKQELIDTGQLPGLNRSEQAELAAASRRPGDRGWRSSIPTTVRTAARVRPTRGLKPTMSTPPDPGHIISGNAGTGHTSRFARNPGWCTFLCSGGCVAKTGEEPINDTTSSISDSIRKNEFKFR